MIQVVCPVPRCPIVQAGHAGTRPRPPLLSIPVPMTKERLIPLIVACALFMENMDRR